MRRGTTIGLLLARNEEHFSRPPRNGPRRKSVEPFFDDQILPRAELRQASRRVQPDAVLAPRRRIIEESTGSYS
jgi:hypothetical protein